MMADKAQRRTHFYPLSMLTYPVCPPPVCQRLLPSPHRDHAARTNNNHAQVFYHHSLFSTEKSGWRHWRATDSKMVPRWAPFRRFDRFGCVCAGQCAFCVAPGFRLSARVGFASPGRPSRLSSVSCRRASSKIFRKVATPRCAVFAFGPNRLCQVVRSYINSCARLTSSFVLETGFTRGHTGHADETHTADRRHQLQTVGGKSQPLSAGCACGSLSLRPALVGMHALSE